MALGFLIPRCHLSSGLYEWAVHSGSLGSQRICREHISLCCINTPGLLTAWCCRPWGTEGNSLLLGCPTHVGCLAASTHERCLWLPTPVVTIESVSRQCQMSPREQRSPWWRSSETHRHNGTISPKDSINPSTCNPLQRSLCPGQHTVSILPFIYPTSKPHRITAGCFELGVLVHSCGPSARIRQTQEDHAKFKPHLIYIELSSRLARTTQQNLSQETDIQAALWCLQIMWQSSSLAPKPIKHQFP